MSCSSGPKIITEGLVFNLDPSNSKSYPAKDDPYRNDVSVLLPFNGANNSTTFTDFSINNLTVTVNGDTKISNAQSKYGGTSAYFDGNGDSLTISSATAFDFTGDFTVEGWFYFSQVNQYNGATVFIAMDVLNAFQFATEGNNIRLRFNGSLLIDYAYTASNLLNTWTHLAITRSGSTVTLWLNGTSVATASSSASINVSALWIGQQINNAAFYHYFNGYINDLRITKASRYSSNFTPPGQLTLFPSRAYDLRNDAIATLTNGPVFSNVQNGVISFDGTDDYVTFSTNNNYALGSGDFTVEFLVNLNSSHQFSLIDFRINETNPNGNAFVIGTNASNQWVVYKGANQITGATSVARTWNHIVVTRVGTSIRLYIDGVQSGSTWTSSDNFTDNALLIGTDYPKNARFFNGKFSYLRIYKGKGFSSNDVALNYAAVRQKFTEIPRTFSGLAVWLDGADLSTLRQNSNATTAATLNSDPVGYWADKSGNGRNATQATAGNRAALSNGTRSLDPAINFAANNWLDLASYTASFGTGSFTIEGWIKPAGYSGTSILLTTGMSGMFVCFTPAGLLNFGKYGVGTTIASTSAISTTSWTKFAITRSGTSLKLFLNDVLNASATDSLSYTGGSAMRIGFDAYSPTGNTKYNGLLQNLLIYEGFSKYN